MATLLDTWSEERIELSEEEKRLTRQLDEAVYELYGLSLEDRTLLEQELLRRPRSESGYSEAELGEGLDEETGANAVDASVYSDDDAGDREVEAVAGIPTVLTPDVGRDLVARWISYHLKQIIESEEDGIVPLDAIHGEPALVIGLREGMERDLGPDAARMLEQEAPEHLGTEDLAEWLAVSREGALDSGGRKQRVPVGFFPWHVELYRNRPIFWLLSSENFEPGRTRMTFRAYLHHLKLTPDTLPRLLTHYLDPTIDIADREWRTAQDGAAKAEGKGERSARAAADEWANTVTALKRFRTALEEVIEGPRHAETVPASAKWLPRTIAQVRGGRDVGHGYRPDVDYGVRVNIAPLVEKKLLPRVALKRLGG